MTKNLISSATSISPQPDCKITIFLNESPPCHVFHSKSSFNGFSVSAMAKLNSHRGDMASVTLETVQSANSLSLPPHKVYIYLRLQCYLGKGGELDVTKKLKTALLEDTGWITIKSKNFQNVTCSICKGISIMTEICISKYASIVKKVTEESFVWYENPQKLHFFSTCSQMIICASFMPH